jgi:hypothetical protein
LAQSLLYQLLYSTLLVSLILSRLLAADISGLELQLSYLEASALSFCLLPCARDLFGCVLAFQR